MFKSVVIIIYACSMLSLDSYGQLKKFYSVKNESTYDTIHFSLIATSGKCYVKPSAHNDPVTIYGNPEFSRVNPTFYSSIKKRCNYVDLNLEDYKKGGLGQTISYNMFGASEDNNKNYWKVYLNDEKIYKLNLNYGIGDANIYLSGIPVANLNIETGSADVNIIYEDTISNRCAMDTFYVKVDFGNFVTQKINLANAKYIIADIGFGNATLSFSDSPTKKCQVNASVGAGNLNINLPKQNAPAIIYFNNSPLCNISMLKEFEEVDKNVYVNKSYSPSADNLIVFNIDVALGNITFKYTD